MTTIKINGINWRELVVTQPPQGVTSKRAKMHRKIIKRLSMFLSAETALIQPEQMSEQADVLYGRRMRDCAYILSGYGGMDLCLEILNDYKTSELEYKQADGVYSLKSQSFGS